MAVEIQPLNLASTLSNAETIRGQRAQNRLLALTEPYKARELQRAEQEGAAAQRDAEMKRTGAAARLALGVIGDVESLDETQRQQRYSAARQMVADLGVDVSKIPPTYSDDVYRGIQALASQYGDDGMKYGLNLQPANIGGRDVLIQPTSGGQGYRVIEGVTPQDKPVVDLQTGALVYPLSNRVVPFGATAQPDMTGRPAPSATADGGQQPASIPGTQAPVRPYSYEELQQQRAEREAAAEAQKQSAATAAKGNVEALTAAIDAANVSVTGIAPVVRALDLLDKVQTGGVQSRWGLALKQAVGSESGDEGELSNLLGRSVLAQLRPIFGAAFTAAEGERLSSIEASFGRSPETNRRLLRNALDVMVESTERGIRAARQRGDTFTANELEMKLRQARAAIDRSGGQNQSQKPASGQPTSSPPVITSKAQYDALPSGAVYVEKDGKRYRKP